MTKFHFVATEIDFKLETNIKKVLAGNWCHNHNNLTEELLSNTEILSAIWDDKEIKENDYNLIQTILTEYCQKLSKYLNEYNKENFSIRFWQILLLPWLTYYLPSHLYKWRIIKKVLKEKKEISFFSLLNENIKKTPTDTAHYYNLIDEDNEFNYSQFRDILIYFKKQNNKISFIEKQYIKKKQTSYKKNSFLKNNKKFILSTIDKIFLFLSKENDIYIEDTTFRKKDYLNMNLKLKQFPAYLQVLFNYKIENQNFKEFKIDMNKRSMISFDTNVKITEDKDFIEYLNSNIINDIPICFVEGFQNLKKSAEKININPKIILSCFKHFFSEKFKFWLANQIEKNNSKLILTFHGGGHHRKFNETFHYERRIADKTATWTTSRYFKEVQLPPNKFLTFKNKRKNYKYLSYVELRSALFPSKFGDRQNIPYTNLQNIKNFNLNLDKKIFDDLIYLPFGKYDYGCVKEIKNILGNNYIQKPISLMNYLNRSKVLVCSYPETPLYEGILTGPTILLYDFGSDLIHNKFKAIFEELSKHKIIFSNTKEASEHINNIWDNVDDWWYSKDIKNILNEFMKQTCMPPNNSISIWSNFLTNQINNKTI